MLLQVEGGHGAIKKDAVWLMDGMVVGLWGEEEKLLLTNDGSKKAVRATLPLTLLVS